jgi:hypothetical protein
LSENIPPWIGIQERYCAECSFAPIAADEERSSGKSASD